VSSLRVVGVADVDLAAGDVVFPPVNDSDRVSPVSACLFRDVGVELRRGTCADTEPLLMMPPCGSCTFIMRKACWAQ
jgi:hypothetical protein